MDSLAKDRLGGAGGGHTAAHEMRVAAKAFEQAEECEHPEEGEPPEEKEKEEEEIAAAEEKATSLQWTTQGCAVDSPHSGALPSAKEFTRFGISMAGLLHLRALFGDKITEESTTSDVCHALIQPATVAEGWIDSPALIDEEKRWYTHMYTEQASGKQQGDSPAGTFSFCELLARADATAHFVGRPTVFLSHAWRYRFLNLLSALASYVSQQPDGSSEVFFWLDCCSIDEHTTQSYPQSWWGSTFKEAIAQIGHTVMVLSPWDSPLPLTRAWCLWELYCTVASGSKFSVCLGESEQDALQKAVVEDGDALLDAFAKIDVANAEAGDPRDKAMIMGCVDKMPGGCATVNAMALDEMRTWVRAQVVTMVRVRSGPGCSDSTTSGVSANGFKSTLEVSREEGAHGDELVHTRSFGNLKLAPEKAQLSEIVQLARLLHQMGDQEDARDLLRAAITEQVALLGDTHKDTLASESVLAKVLFDLDQQTDAEQLLQQVIDWHTKVDGPAHYNTLTAQKQMADFVSERDSRLFGREKAIRLYQQVIAGVEQVIEEHRSRHGDVQDEEQMEEDEKDRMGYEKLSDVVGLLFATKSNYAATLSECPGRRREACHIYTECIDYEITVSGPTHFDVLKAKGNLANDLSEMGQYEEAEALYKEVLGSQRALLGSQHVWTLRTQSNYAMLLVDVGRYEEARLMLSDVVASHAVVLGDTNVERLGVKIALAESMWYCGDKYYAEAKTLLANTLETLIAVEDQHETSYETPNQCRAAQAEFLAHTGEHERALLLLQKAVDDYTQELGEDDPETLEMLAQLCELQITVGDLEGPTRLMPKVLASMTETRGAENCDVLALRSHGALLMQKQGKIAEAEAEYREVLQLQQSHPNAMWALQTQLRLDALLRGEVISYPEPDARKILREGSQRYPHATVK